MKPIFTTIEQVCFIVKDLDAAVRMFADGLGIGPWLMVNFGHKEGDPDFENCSVKVEDTVLYGKYVGDYAIRLACCDMQGTQIELIQPLDDKSLFSLYAREDGMGGQHIATDNTVSFEEILGIMAANGFPLSQLAKIDDTEDCAFVDHMRLLGTHIELHRRPENWDHPEVEPMYYPPDRIMKRPPVFDSITQVGFAVQDTEAAVKFLCDQYGIGPWIIADFGCSGDPKNAISMEDATIDGKPIGEVGIRIGVCSTLNVQLEMLQSARGNDIVGQYFNSRGPGIHHLCMTMAGSYEDTLKALEEAGLTRGQRTLVDNKQEVCHFIDCMDTIGAYIEFQQRPENYDHPDVTPRFYPENTLA